MDEKLIKIIKELLEFSYHADQCAFDCSGGYFKCNCGYDELCEKIEKLIKNPDFFIEK